MLNLAAKEPDAKKRAARDLHFLLRAMHWLGMAQGNTCDRGEYNGAFTSDTLSAIETLAPRPEKPNTEDVRWYPVDFKVERFDKRKIHCVPLSRSILQQEERKRVAYATDAVQAPSGTRFRDYREMLEASRPELGDTVVTDVQTFLRHDLYNKTSTCLICLQNGPVPKGTFPDWYVTYTAPVQADWRQYEAQLVSYKHYMCSYKSSIGNLSEVVKADLFREVGAMHLDAVIQKLENTSEETVEMILAKLKPKARSVQGE